MSESAFIDRESELALRRAARVYPQPVAVGCGRLLRSRTPESLVDATLKAGEILARYMAAAGIASHAARKDAAGTDRTLDLTHYFEGSLAFGVFFDAARALATTSYDHPLRDQLRAGLAPKGKGKQKQPGKTQQSLEKLLLLRNHLGHDLTHLNAAKAQAILESEDPVGSLVNACGGVQGLLSLPLFVVEEQRVVKKQLNVRWLMLMGENTDPEPEVIISDHALEHDHVPYVGYGNVALCLSPLLVWSVAQRAQNFRLFVVDAVTEQSLRFKAIATDPLVLNGPLLDTLHSILIGDSRPAEPFVLDGGVGSMSHWLAIRRRREAVLQQESGIVPWADFDQDTLKWYGHRLDSSCTDFKKTVVTSLLDDRSRLEPREIVQLTLLLGTDQAVKKVLRRELLDLRARSGGEGRWTERVETHANVLGSLRQAVEFFARHVGLEGISLDGLEQTAGSADYIAMREALINLFIHQDYQDSSAAAQVELESERAMFFNPGYSLVSSEALVTGGKSQSRNPLIARALRLIGFAELGGSGLREIHRLWRNERRRPPRIETDRESNTFTLTLDWRPVPGHYDESWKQRIGAHLNEEEAIIVNLSADGITAEEAASATGLMIEDTRSALDRLERQVLISKSGESYRLAEHLRELINEPTRGLEPETQRPSNGSG